MKLFRSWPLAVLAVLVSVVPCLAQVPAGWVQVTAAHTIDAGVPIANGTVSFAPVGNTGVATSFRVGSAMGGQAGPDPWTALVTNGAFTILVPDSVLAYPTEVCYSITITDNASGNSILGPGYTCVQPAGSGGAISGSQAWCTAGTGGAGATCNFDNFLPVLTPNVFGSGFDSAGSALAAQNAAEAFATEAVGTETSRAETAEATIAAGGTAGATAISNEITRAEGAEATNAAAIAAEASRAEGAESTLTTSLAAATATANAALPANGATSTGSGTSNVVTFPGVLAAQTFSMNAPITIPLVNVNTVMSETETQETLSGSSPAGDVTNFLGDCHVSGSATPINDAHCVSIKGLYDFFATSVVPKGIGLEGAVTVESGANTLTSGIAVQGIFGGILAAGSSITTYANFQADAVLTNLGTIGRYIDFHSSGLGSFCSAGITNGCFTFLNEDPLKIFETYGRMAIGSVSPQALLHVYGGSSGQSYPTGLTGGMVVENGGTSPTSLMFLTMTAAGYGLGVSNAGKVGIGESAGSSYPLEIAANGMTLWVGDGSASTYGAFAGGRAFVGYDGTNGNAVLAGTLAKGVGFIPVSTNAVGTYAGLFDVNDCFGVGSNPNACTSDAFYVTAAGVEHATNLYTTGASGVGTATLPTGVEFDAYSGASGQTYPTFGGALVVETAGSSSSVNLMTLSAAGFGLGVSNAGKVGIGESAGATYPLQIAANGEAQSLGDGSTSAYEGFAGNRALVGYDATNANVAVQGIAGKAFEVNVNNNTFGSGTALIVDATGSLGVGTNGTTAASDLFYVTSAGVEHAADVYTTGASGVGTATLPSGAELDVYTGSSGQTYPTFGGALVVETAGSSSSINLMTLSAAGFGLGVSNAGKVGIGEGAGATYPLQIAANGEAESLGDGSSSAYEGFAVNRAFVGYDATNANVAVQGIVGKGFEVNVNNNTFGSGTALIVDATGSLGVGTNGTTAASDPFYVTAAGVEHAADLYTTGASGVGTATLPTGTELDVYTGSSGQTYPTFGGALLIETAGSSSSINFMTLTAGGFGLGVSNAGKVGIGEGAGATYPLQIAANGEAESLGDGTTSAYAGFTGNRGLVGYDATTANAAIQGISGKGFEVNVNNSTFGSGTALVVDHTGSLGVGTNGTTASSDPFYVTAAGAATALSYGSDTKCANAASPAVCAAAPAGAVVVAAGSTTVVVNTSAVTAAGQIHLTFDASLGTALGVTCNTTINQPTVSARSAGTSFTVTMANSIAANPDCVSYTFEN